MPYVEADCDFVRGRAGRCFRKQSGIGRTSRRSVGRPAPCANVVRLVVGIGFQSADCMVSPNRDMSR